MFYEFLMYFIVLWISYVFYCFMISAVWDLHLDQYQAEVMIYKAKRGQNSWFTGQNENCHLFCTQNEKKFTFWVDLWSQKVMWLRNRRSDCRKLGVKISARLQRKKVMKRRSWKRGGFECAVKFVMGGPLRPPPPPVQLAGMPFFRLLSEFRLFPTFRLFFLLFFCM